MFQVPFSAANSSGLSLERTRVTKEVSGDLEDVKMAPGVIPKEHEKFPGDVEEIVRPFKEVK